MGREYDNNNSGALFVNDRKSSPNQPDYRGNADIEGVDYWVSAWVKSTGKGNILSLAFTPKSATGAPPRSQANNSQAQTLQPTPLAGQQAQQPGGNNGWGQPGSNNQNNEPPMDFDDDIPF